MIKQGMTISDAAHEWVGEMNAFPQDMIAKLMEFDIDSWREVTAKSVGKRVYVYENGAYGEITAYNEETEEYTVELDNCDEVQVTNDDMELDNYDGLPMWGTLWQFGDGPDDWWLEEEEGIRLMSECGFRIYEHDEWGYFFGIDGAGYDFYEAHWIPLYKARGLRWHDEVAEKECQMLRKGYVKRKLGAKEYWYDGDKCVCEA